MALTIFDVKNFDDLQKLAAQSEQAALDKSQKELQKAIAQQQLLQQQLAQVPAGSMMPADLVKQLKNQVDSTNVFLYEKARLQSQLGRLAKTNKGHGKQPDLQKRDLLNQQIADLDKYIKSQTPFQKTFNDQRDLYLTKANDDIVALNKQFENIDNSVISNLVPQAVEILKKGGKFDYEKAQELYKKFDYDKQISAVKDKAQSIINPVYDLFDINSYKQTKYQPNRLSNYYSPTTDKLLGQIENVSWNIRSKPLDVSAIVLKPAGAAFRATPDGQQLDLLNQVTYFTNNYQYDVNAKIPGVNKTAKEIWLQRESNPQQYYRDFAGVLPGYFARALIGSPQGSGVDMYYSPLTADQLQKTTQHIQNVIQGLPQEMWKYVSPQEFQNSINAGISSYSNQVNDELKRNAKQGSSKFWDAVNVIGNIGMSVAAFSIGGPPAAAAVNGFNSYVQGASLEDALKNAAISYASQAVGQTVGGLTSTGIEYGVNPLSEQAAMLAAQSGDMLKGTAAGMLGGAAGSVASGATAAALSGGDPQKAIENALINAAGNVAGTVAGGGAPGAVVSGAVNSLLTGGNMEDAITRALTNYALNTGTKYVMNSAGRLVDSLGKEAPQEVASKIIDDAHNYLISEAPVDQQGTTLNDILATTNDILSAEQKPVTDLASADTGTITDVTAPTIGPVEKSLFDLVSEQQAQDPFYVEPQYDDTVDLTSLFKDVAPVQEPIYVPPTPTVPEKTLAEMVAEQQAQDPFYTPPQYDDTTDLTPTFKEPDLIDLVREQQAQDPFYVEPQYDDTTDLTPTFKEPDLIDLVREQQAQDPFYVEPEYDDTTDLTSTFGEETTGGGGGLPSGGGGGGGTKTTTGGGTTGGGGGGLPSGTPAAPSTAPATDPFAQIKPLSIPRADMADIQAYNPLEGAVWGQAINLPTPTYFSPAAQPTYFDARQMQDSQQFAEGGLVDHNPEFFSEGGASLANRYVKGDGDGTSDSVPAMLASGEFVIPADVVSALGNGDNDAGAGVLDKFLAVIRNHKRDAHEDDLPPDSKGPLTYLAEAQKRAQNGRT